MIITSNLQTPCIVDEAIVQSCEQIDWSNAIISKQVH